MFSERQVQSLPDIVHNSDAFNCLRTAVEHFSSACSVVGSLKRSNMSCTQLEELLSASHKDDYDGLSIRNATNDTLRLKVLLLMRI